MGDNPGKKTILLIDDDSFFLNVTVSILAEKYNVLTVKSGKQALMLLVKNSPDLILLDILMPEMDGWEIFNKIRGISLLDHVPIAFITSVNEPGGLENAQKLGASDYFIKPLDRENFLNRVENILDKNQTVMST